jgi:hypothetical protein
VALASRGNARLAVRGQVVLKPGHAINKLQVVENFGGLRLSRISRAASSSTVNMGQDDLALVSRQLNE